MAKSFRTKGNKTEKGIEGEWIKKSKREEGMRTSRDKRKE